MGSLSGSSVVKSPFGIKIRFDNMKSGLIIIAFILFAACYCSAFTKKSEIKHLQEMCDFLRNKGQKTPRY